MRANFHLGRLLVFVIFSVCPMSMLGQAKSPIKRDLVWSQAGTEIDSLKFSPDGHFIVIVNRTNWPDGAEAEGVPESVFKELEARKKKDPRFADPVVKLIDLTGRTVCEAAYGWNPDVSTDNKHLVYSRQKQAITGLRVLAETQAGNDIQLFDCDNKQGRTIAAPDSGYLDNPMFFDGGDSVVYTENEGVNGAYAGTVAFDSIDFQKNLKSTVLRRESVPAVPCPSTAESVHDSIICSQATNRVASYYQLVLQSDSNDKQLIALLAKPIPSLPDFWMTSNYDLRAVLLQPATKEIHAFGKKRLGDLDQAAIQLASEQRALIFSNYWRVVSLKTGKYVGEVIHRNAERASLYSPDLKYYLSPEPPGDEPNHFALYRASDAKRLASLPTMVRVNEAAWSRNSKRFAIVGLPRKPRNSTYTEQMTVYSVP